MAIKKGQIKEKVNDSLSNILYPETSADQVVNLGEAVRISQKNTCVVRDALHNISNKELASFHALETTLGVYPVIKILTSTDIKVTEAQAATYMLAQTGSAFVPTYDFDTPNFTYLVFANGKIYKPQYDSTNGLVLYYVNQLAFAGDLKTTIEKVEDISDIPDDELGLYRFTEEVGGVTQSSHVYEVVKEDHGAEEREFYKTTETNGTQLTTGTFMSQFYLALTNFVSCSAVANVYAFYYDNEYVSQNGIRIGTKNTGSITLTLSEAGTIYFGKYFSYNGSTHVVTYDADSKVIVDGTDEYTFSSDTATVGVELAAGTHTITSNGQDITGGSAQGRILLLGFEFMGEPYSMYTPKALARAEEVQAVENALTSHISTTNVRFADDERAINTNTQGITDINSRMGDIQMFQGRNSLPNPSADYLYKILRVQNKLYQCIASGDGALKTWDFADVSGTSEITSSNVDSFYGNAGNNFNDYFSVYYDPEDVNTTTKFYRNNGSLKLGSSSATGALFLSVESDLAISSLKIGVKAYNTNGSAVFFEADNGDETYFVSSDDGEVLFDLTNIASGSSYVYIVSQGTHTEGEEGSETTFNNDKRLIITKIIAEFGDVTYKWVPAAMPMLEFTDTLKIKDIPQGGAYLFWPEGDGNGTVVYKYFDGSYTELYFQNPDGYSEYDGNNVENTTVQDAYDNADWYSYAIDSNVVHKTGSENISGAKYINGDALRFGPASTNYYSIQYDSSSLDFVIGAGQNISSLGSIYLGNKVVGAGSNIKLTPDIHTNGSNIIFKEGMWPGGAADAVHAEYVFPTEAKGSTSSQQGEVPRYTIATTEEIPQVKRYI